MVALLIEHIDIHIPSNMNPSSEIPGLGAFCRLFEVLRGGGGGGGHYAWYESMLVCLLFELFFAFIFEMS